MRQGKLNSQFIVTARINFLMVAKIFIFQYGPRPLKIRGVVRTDVLRGIKDSPADFIAKKNKM